MRRARYFALRLQASLIEEVRKVANADGVNQLINVAVAEKVSILRTEEYFAERAAHGDLKKALQVLKRAGRGNPPLPGDELPAKIPLRIKIKAGTDALERGDFTEVDDADLESHLERLTTPAPKQAR
jgi:hypothetical protein